MYLKLKVTKTIQYNLQANENFLLLTPPNEV